MVGSLQHARALMRKRRGQTCAGGQELVIAHEAEGLLRGRRQAHVGEAVGGQIQRAGVGRGRRTLEVAEGGRHAVRGSCNKQGHVLPLTAVPDGTASTWQSHLHMAKPPSS
jgi:hypothetical protein